MKSQNQISNPGTIFLMMNLVRRSKLTKYISSIFIVSAVGLLLFYLRNSISYHAVSLVFLFIVSLLPLLNFKPGPIFAAAVASALIWNFYFIPPAFTFRISSVEDALMYIMYFVVATVSSFLISRIRMQQLLLDQKEKRTAALFSLTRDLSAAKSLDEVTRYSILHLKETFQTEAVFIYADSNTLQKVPDPSSTIKIDEGEWNIAQMVFLSLKKAGRFTQSAQTVSALTYVPLFTKDHKLGVAGLLFSENTEIDEDTLSMLDSFITQISIAVEREYLMELAQKNLVLAESEKLYKTLFDSVSHELKTPITTLLGAVSSLKDDRIIINQNIFNRLIDEAAIATERLRRLVENLLDITRLESGILKPKKEWHSVADLIHSAVNKLRSEGLDQKITFCIDENTGLCFFDYPLIEQALINVIHNSAEYSSPGSITEITSVRQDKNILISIGDNGPGFPEKETENIFKKFYRVPGTKAGGTGLGLSIAKGFIEAHGGKITARNRQTGGAEFLIMLPLE